MKRQQEAKNGRQLTRLGAAAWVAVALACPLLNDSADSNSKSRSVIHRTNIRGAIRVGRTDPSEFPNLARIDWRDAIETAQMNVPGRLVSISLDTDDGYLVYWVDMETSDARVIEVIVDAGSGRVLKVQTEESPA